MFPSGRVEMMHGKAYRGRFPCVTKLLGFSNVTSQYDVKFKPGIFFSSDDPIPKI
jgi:hypothetical protein